MQSVGIEFGGTSFKSSLMVMDMQEYDVILGMDGLTQHSAIIDCAKKRVLVECPRQGLCSMQGMRLGKPKFVISAIKAYSSLERGLCWVLG